MKSWVGGSAAALLLMTCSPALAAPDLPDTIAPDATAPDAVTQAMQTNLKAQVDARLKDPYSAHYDFKPAQRGSCRSGWFGSGGRKYGWVMEFTVNAKNSYGAYGGAEPYTGLLYDQTQELVAWEGFKFGLMGHGACRFEIDAAPKRLVRPGTSPEPS